MYEAAQVVWEGQLPAVMPGETAPVVLPHRIIRHDICGTRLWLWEYSRHLDALGVPIWERVPECDKAPGVFRAAAIALTQSTGGAVPASTSKAAEDAV